MRGAFFVNAEANIKKEDRLIDFFILDPNYQVIYSKRKQEEGIFRFNATMRGQYTFVFSNMKDRVNTKKVTLAIHPGYEKEEDDFLSFQEKKESASKQRENMENEIREMANAANVDEEDIRGLESTIR